MASGGALSDSGSALDIRAIMDEFGHDVDVETEEIRPIWSVQQNNVYISSGNRLSITALNKSLTANLLADVADTHTAGYVKVVWTEGDEIYTGYFKVGSLRGGMRGHGRQTKTLELLSCDVTDPQVVRTLVP
jgi:hypothetical protein